MQNNQPEMTIDSFINRLRLLNIPDDMKYIILGLIGQNQQMQQMNSMFILGLKHVIHSLKDTNISEYNAHLDQELMKELNKYDLEINTENQNGITFKLVSNFDQKIQGA